MNVLKTKFLQIRISDTLKSRYHAALQAGGITKTDHLNSVIIRYVEEYEKKKDKKTAALK